MYWNSCHKCGGPVRRVADGNEWCDSCSTSQRHPDADVKIARIERNPVVYRISEPPEICPHFWRAWDDKTGKPLGTAILHQTLARAMKKRGYQPRRLLRWGDNGRNRYLRLVKWFFHHRLAKKRLAKVA